MEHTLRPPLLKHRSNPSRLDCLSPKEQVSYLSERIGNLTSYLIEQSSCQKQNSDSLFPQLGREHLERKCYIFTHPHEPSAVEQSAPHFEGDRIKRSVGCLS